MYVRRSRPAFGLHFALTAVTVLTAACTAAPGPSYAGADTRPTSASPPGAQPASGSPSPSDSTSAAALVTGRALTREQLVAAAIPDAEVPDSHGNPVRIRTPRKPDPRFGPPSDLACGRVLDAAYATMNVNTAPVVADQTYNWKGDAFGSSAILASYTESRAQIVFMLLRDGLTTCRSYEQKGPSGMYYETMTTSPAPPLGDEAVRFEVSTPTETGRHVRQYTVVRTGHCVATFIKRSDGQEGTAFPSVVISRQIALLEEAQR